jgi:hypothetical protein
MMTVTEIAAQLGVGHNAVQEMMETLGYQKVCSRWVPRFLTEEHKTVRRDVSSQLLRRYAVEGDNFLLNIVTGDESWFHHFDPETKRHNMEWHHLTSPKKKKTKTVPSAGKVMGTVFWESEECILVDFLEKGKTINAARYVQTLNKLRCALREKRP